MAERPTGLKATKGIELLTFGTPNGHKASIILEELKEAYGKDYTWQSINIMQNIQKEPCKSRCHVRQDNWANRLRA